MTLFLVSESAQNEILQKVTKTGSVKPVEPINNIEVEADLNDLREDIRARATEFIKDKLSQLDWQEMQELVAGILRAMGYKTRVSQPPNDRGKDVLASPDGLGFTQPRIRAEVKHRQGAMGAEQIRSFAGGLRSSDRGLYVSTGGFTKEAHYEAERSTIPITLLDIDELTQLLIEVYDNLDTDSKALVPLVKIYWPA